MEKKIYGYNIQIDLKNKLDEVAKANGKSASFIVNELISSYLGEDKKKKEQKKAAPVHVVTEEERLADWEWRKTMVAEGKLPKYMADEYPVTLLADEDKNYNEKYGARV